LSQDIFWLNFILVVVVVAADAAASVAVAVVAVVVVVDVVVVIVVVVVVVVERCYPPNVYWNTSCLYPCETISGYKSLFVS